MFGYVYVYVLTITVMAQNGATTVLRFLQRQMDRYDAVKEEIEKLKAIRGYSKLNGLRKVSR